MPGWGVLPGAEGILGSGTEAPRPHTPFQAVDPALGGQKGSG